MTAQVPDKLIFQGGEHALFGNPLESYFDEDHPRPEFRVSTSANWRGYVAKWELENDTLYLVSLSGWVGGDDGTHTTKSRPVGIKDVFPWAEGRVKATWFTGKLQLPQGELLQYVHMGYGSTYEKDLLLTFEQGRLVHREVRDNRGLPPDITEEPKT